MWTANLTENALPIALPILEEITSQLDMILSCYDLGQQGRVHAIIFLINIIKSPVAKSGPSPPCK